MTDHSETAWEQDEIESHLRSAMDALTPNVFDKTFSLISWHFPSPPIK